MHVDIIYKPDACMTGMVGTAAVKIEAPQLPGAQKSTVPWYIHWDGTDRGIWGADQMG